MRCRASRASTTSSRSAAPNRARSRCVSAWTAMPTPPRPTCVTAWRRRAALLPDEADEPIVQKQEADAQPIIYLAFSSDRHSLIEIADYRQPHGQGPRADHPGRRPGAGLRQPLCDAHLAQSRAPGRRRPDAGRRRGGAARAEHRNPRRPRREPAARVHRAVGNRPARPRSSSPRSSSRTPAATWCAWAMSPRSSSAPIHRASAPASTARTRSRWAWSSRRWPIRSISRDALKTMLPRDHRAPCPRA